MALSDFESYIRDRLLAWNPSLDVSSGSPIDAKVVQPVLQRVGTDPFTVDAYTFIMARLTQAFPDLAVGNGDSLEDLVVKSVLLLWDPIIREIQRVKGARSFSNPALLSTEEAEELGSTFFVPRDTGDTARGPARVYFAQPQNSTVTAGNFLTSKGGLIFFPTGQQSIQATEMSLNREDDLYYFDIDVVGAAPGDQYNIEPKELTSIANIGAAVRVSNKVRFRDGRPAEDAETYVSRLERHISERSMVSNRGIAAVVGGNIPEIARLAVVGMNDPEMKRDILSGGSLGAPAVVGVDGEVVSDGRFEPRSRRLRSISSDFFSVGAMGESRGLVLTVMGGMGPGASPPIRDLNIVRIVAGNEVEVDESVLFLGAQNVPFTVRRRELTLSGIPGGILRPSGPNGTVTVRHDEVHIGGCTDIYARATTLDTQTLQIDTVADETPEFFGTQASVPAVLPGDPPWVQLNELVLGTNYQVGDRTYSELARAKTEQYVFQILDGVIAGTYRILGVNLGGLGSSPLLQLDPAPLAVSSSLRFRWRLVTDLELDLIEVKEVRLSGTNGVGAQNSDVFSTSSFTDLDALGVAAGDVVRLGSSAAAGDYEVTELISPGTTSVRLNRKFPASFSGVKFQIFRPNEATGVRPPMIRITSAELLDTSGQPLGVKVPPALPVGVTSLGFSNVGAGVKVTAPYAALGIVSKEHVTLGPNFGVGGLLVLEDDAGVTLNVSLTGHRTVAQMVSDINAASLAHPLIGYSIAAAADASLSTKRIRITAFGPNTRTAPTSNTTVLLTFFGDQEEHTSRDIRDISSSPVTWLGVSPAIDPVTDVIRVLDGTNSGFYLVDRVSPTPTPPFAPANLIRVAKDLAPDFGPSVQVGGRSFGGARLLFLEPTSAEIGPGTRFSGVSDSGGDVFFLADATVGRQVIPPLPGNDKPLDGVSSGTTLSSSSTDFLRLAREGDRVELDFVPLTCATNLSDPHPGLALKDLYVSLLDRMEKIVTFVNDVGTPGAVSRDGIAAQLNSALGMDVASIVEVSPGDFRLKINAQVALRVRRLGSANSVLGVSVIADTRNASPHDGAYTIVSVGVSTVEVSPPFPLGTVTEGQFVVTRPGVQRITATEMEKNAGPAGLYFWDVELFSEGAGNAWNLAVGAELDFTGVKGDGYILKTLDPNTTFSPAESLRMVLSRSILPSGVDDSPLNSVQLPGQALRISYEYAEVIDTLQGLASSDTERVVNSSPLARHLIPHFVRFNLEYTGGSREEDIQPELETMIRNTPPSDPLYSSEVQDIVRGRGATSIRNPIDLIAVTYHPDRRVRLDRSQDSVSTGRLSAFFPDRVKLVRRAR